jgi:hypothetical protein
MIDLATVLCFELAGIVAAILSAAMVADPVDDHPDGTS